MRRDVEMLIARVRRQGVVLSLEGEDLLCELTAGDLSEAQIDEIRASKAQIVECMRDEADADSIVRVDREPAKVEEDESSAAYPTTQMEGAFFLFGTDSLVITAHFEHVGRFDEAAAAKALNDVAQRQAMLRTTFELNASRTQINQRVHSKTVYSPAVVDLREALREAAPEARFGVTKRKVQELVDELDVDFSVLPLFRFYAIRLEDERTLFLCNFHHIITDGTSRAIFARDFLHCYTAALAGRAPGLPPLRASYLTWTRWESDRVRDPRVAAYWKERIGAIEFDALLAPRLDAAPDGERCNVVGYGLAAEPLRAALRAARELNTAPLRFLEVLVLIAFVRTFGLDRLNALTIVNNRPHPALNDVIGCFVTGVVIEVDGRVSETAAELFDDVSAQVMNQTARLPYSAELGLGMYAGRLIRLNSVTEPENVRRIPFGKRHFEERPDLDLMYVDANLTQHDDGLTISFSFDDKTFRPELFDDVVGDLLRLLDSWDEIKGGNAVGQPFWGGSRAGRTGPA